MRRAIVLACALVVLGLLAFALRPTSDVPISPRAGGASTPSVPGPTSSATPGLTTRPPLSAAPQREIRQEELDRRFRGPELERFKSMSKERQAREMARIEGYEAVVLDPKASAHARGEAFMRLASEGALSDVCVKAMTELLQSQPAASSVRASLCESLGARAERPEVREALIVRLRADTDEMVRKRAAFSLGAVKDDPLARRALEDALRTEQSEFVRRALQNALRKAPADK